MSILSNQIARMMDARDAGGARFGAAAAADHALAIERVWERRADALVVRGTAESGAQHLAAAAASCFRRAAEAHAIEMELPESELDFIAARVQTSYGVDEARWRMAGQDLLLDGLGLELYDPRPVAAFLAARFPGASAPAPRVRATTWIWTPLDWSALADRYGGDTIWRLRQAAAEIVLP